MTTRSDPPSPRKLRRARASGDYPRSPLLRRGLLWVTALSVLPALARSLWTYGAARTRLTCEGPNVHGQDLGRLAVQQLNQAIQLSLPVLAVVLVAQLATQLVENRGAMLARSTRPHLFARLGATWSFQAIASLGLQWMSFALLLGFGWFWLRTHGLPLASTLGQPSRARDLSTMSALHLAWAGGCLWCAFGLADFVIAHRAWLRRMRMTSTEKRHEQQEYGGNPWLAQQRHERHRDVLTGSTLSAVRDATFVTHARFELVVLLRYVPERDQAPRVLGVSVGAMASRCIRAATDLGIAVIEDEPLARALARGRPEAPVPESLYDRVAEHLAGLPGFANPPSLYAEPAPGLLRP